MTEEMDRHVAYVEDLFEDKKFRKKLRVRWFHKPSELTCRIPPPVPHLLEVFYTAFEQDLSVECVDGIAIILSPEHHETCSAVLPVNTMSQAFVCFRQFDNDGVRPFSIQEVKGYWHQRVLSLAGIMVSRENSPCSDEGSDDLEIDDEEGADPGRLIRKGPRTARCSRRRTEYGNRIRSTLKDSATLDMAACISSELRESGSGDGKHIHSNGSRKDGSNHGQELLRFEIGDHIEILSEDSGLRGCWFKGTVLRRAWRCLKVRYDDVVCEDGKGNLEEWISSCRMAAPCKLGIRVSGRMCIRPSPPEDTCPLRLLEGEAVDAWWHDGWWEGIFCGSETSGFVNVFIPGEQQTAVFKPSDLRTSMDWLSGSWVPIADYPDVDKLLGLSRNNSEVRKEVNLSSREPDGRKEADLMEDGDKINFSCSHVSSALTARNVVNHNQDLHLKTYRRARVATNVKDEQLADPGMQCKSEVVDCFPGSPILAPGSPTSGVDNPSVHNAANLEQPEDSVTSETKECGMEGLFVNSQPQGPGLKWKVGKKRHRPQHRDLLISRVDSHSTLSVNDMKIFNTVGANEDAKCEGVKEEILLQENFQSNTIWKNGDDEDIMRLKKQRQGNDSSLKSLHGPAMGSSIFIGSIPMGNLVMSR